MRGVLQPVLDHLRRRLPGDARLLQRRTVVHDIAEDDDGRPLIALYVGDFDPSGMFMSEEDLPKRLAKYGGDHIRLKRIALTRPQVRGLPSFPARRQEERPALQVVRRQLWQACWELDAMDPNDLRDCVEQEIRS